MKIGRWEGNEIIYTQDMNGNSTNLMENFDFVTDILEDTMIVSGMVISQATVPDMTIKISSGIARDATVGTFLKGEDLVAVIPAAHATLDRRDIIEVRRLIEDITPSTRQFKDPISAAISSSVIDTESEYKTEIKVLAGTAGAVATSVEPGYIKIAEILVPAASTTVIDANIYNVDAEKAGIANTSWTNSTTVIYRNGSISEMKTEIVDSTDLLTTYLINGIPKYDPTKTYVIAESFVQDEGMIWLPSAGSTGFKPSTNQDKWNPVSAPEKSQTVNASGTITLGYANHLIGFDTSLGNISPDLPAGSFKGQTLSIFTTGSGIVDIGGTGLYVNRVFQTSNTGILIIKWTGTEWRAENGVTADYVSGIWRIIKTSSGSLEQYFIEQAIGVGGTNFIFVISYVGSYLINVSAQSVLPRFLNYDNNLSASLDVNIWSDTGSQTSGIANCQTKGKY